MIYNDRSITYPFVFNLNAYFDFKHSLPFRGLPKIFNILVKYIKNSAEESISFSFTYWKTLNNLNQHNFNI